MVSPSRLVALLPASISSNCQPARSTLELVGLKISTHSFSPDAGCATNSLILRSISHSGSGVGVGVAVVVGVGVAADAAVAAGTNANVSVTTSNKAVKNMLCRY